MLAKLASQVADMHVESPILATEFAVEHFRDQTLAFDDRTGRLDEASHDFVFLRRKIEWRVVQVDLATGLMTGDAGDPAHDARQFSLAPEADLWHRCDFSEEIVFREKRELTARRTSITYLAGIDERQRGLTKG